MRVLACALFVTLAIILPAAGDIILLQDPNQPSIATVVIDGIAKGRLHWSDPWLTETFHDSDSTSLALTTGEIISRNDDVDVGSPDWGEGYAAASNRYECTIGTGGDSVSLRLFATFNTGGSEPGWGRATTTTEAEFHIHVASDEPGRHGRSLGLQVDVTGGWNQGPWQPDPLAAEYTLQLTDGSNSLEIADSIDSYTWSMQGGYTWDRHETFPTHVGTDVQITLNYEGWAGSGPVGVAGGTDLLVTISWLPIPGAGDFDFDFDVDLADFLIFQVCFTGPGGGPVDPGCEPGDLDGDDDIDLWDFVSFQGAFTGPNPPPVLIDSESASAVPIGVSPPDLYGNSNGQTPFERLYRDGDQITLVAPLIHDGHVFDVWRVNGEDQPLAGHELTLTVHGGITAVAAYYPKITIDSVGTTGVPIEVSPADEAGQADGSTPFTRTYAVGTQVTLTAPLIQDGRGFRNWTLDSVEQPVGQTTLTFTVNDDAPIAAVAEYLSIVTINSIGVVDVPIEVSPADEMGQADGETPFTRTYALGTQVTLTAPASQGSQIFTHWQLDSVDQPAGQTSLTFTVNDDVQAVATYVRIRTLTVTSNEADVPITVSPPDLSGDSDGTTDFVRCYKKAAAVTLTAPSTSPGGAAFTRWNIDGYDYPLGNRNVTLYMTTDHTANAAYE